MSISSHDAPHDGGPVARALAHAADVLPDPGPIGVFIHHNTLHAFQHLPFREAVIAGAAAIGAEPFPAETFLRDAWRRGRIDDVDVELALASDPGTTDAPLPLGLTVRDARLALLRDELDVDDAAGVHWLKAHGHLTATRRPGRRTSRAKPRIKWSGPTTGIWGMNCAVDDMGDSGGEVTIGAPVFGAQGVRSGCRHMVVRQCPGPVAGAGGIRRIVTHAPPHPRSH
jgi:hypothetical protein